MAQRLCRRELRSAKRDPNLNYTSDKAYKIAKKKLKQEKAGRKAARRGK
jgi:hypothetical protein